MRRQLCLDYLVEHYKKHGRATGQVLLDDVPTMSPSFRTQLSRETRVPRARRGRMPIIMKEGGRRPFGTASIAPFLCPAGHPAGVATRIPENPSDLLCECGRPAGKTDPEMPPGLVFPATYQLLRVPHQDALVATQEETRLRAERMGPVQRAFLFALDGQGELPLDAIHDQMVASGYDGSVHFTHIRGTKTKLQDFGFIDTADSMWRNPKWRLTEAGRAQAEQLRLTFPDEGLPRT
jgi:hypothetical protein